METLINTFEDDVVEERYIIWANEPGFITIYTKMVAIKNVLKKLGYILATYERNGKVFAWQTIVPKSKKAALLVKLNKIEME